MKFFIILCALGLLVFLIVRPFIRGNIKNTRKKEHDGIEEMCQCEHCGIYVVSSESLLSDGRYFCSKECLKKGVK